MKKIINVDLLENDFIRGGIVGITQTLFGHPFDTIKVLQQNNIKITKSLIKPTILMSGISYPLIISTYYNSGIFGIFSILKNKNFSNFQSGFLSGAVMSIILNPFEYYKVNSQITEINKKKFNNKLWRGLHFTIARESLATGIYFHNYYWLKKNNINSFIAGGIAGCNSWLLTYPIDTIKTRYQINKNLKYKDLLYQKHIYKGLSSCLFRAFLVNGISFSLYDFLIN